MNKDPPLTTTTTTTTTTYSELKWGDSAPPLDHAAAADDRQCLFDESSPQAKPVDDSSQTPHDNNNNNNNNNSTTDNNRWLLPLHAETTALLVVDVQPEYWSQCPAVRRDFPDFPARLAATVDTCRRQGCSKIIWVRADYSFAHSPWLKQFARIHGLEPQQQQQQQSQQPPNDHHPQQHLNNNQTTTTHHKPPKHTHMRTEVPCDPTSKEFTWEEFAVPAGGEVILPKTSWSSTSNAAFLDILHASQVDTVLVCGLITSVCVQHSAFGLFEAGYRTILVTDACADRGKARHEAALALYGDYMYELVCSADLVPSTLLAAKPLWILPPRAAAAVESHNKGVVLDHTRGVMFHTDSSSSSPTLLSSPPMLQLLSAGASLSTSTSQSSLSSSVDVVCSSVNHQQLAFVDHDDDDDSDDDDDPSNCSFDTALQEMPWEEDGGAAS